MAGRMLASGSRLFIAAMPLCLLMFAKRGQTTFEATRGQLVLAVCIIGLVGTFYTTLGGIRTVVWTDVTQFFIVVGAAILSIVLLLHRIGRPIPEIVHILGQPGTGPGGHSKLLFLDFSTSLNAPFSVWASVLGYSFLTTASFGVDQDFAQRFLISKSPLKGALSILVFSGGRDHRIRWIHGDRAASVHLLQAPDIMGSQRPDIYAGSAKRLSELSAERIADDRFGNRSRGFFRDCPGVDGLGD